MTEVTPWGFHLILDVAECDSSRIRSEDNIRAFAHELVKAIDMVAFGEPQIVRFGSGDKQGYTLVQLIETSNICAHFVEENDTAYIDIFSCKPFDQTVAIDVVRKYFEFKRFNVGYLERRA